MQNGQRINNYKIEYRNGDSGAWTLLEEGKTIGAKRLCRTSETTARQIKITVGTCDGKVPMISEIEYTSLLRIWKNQIRFQREWKSLMWKIRM
ncbi:MAG: hypothetical protein ACLRMN_13495 [Mediterraneibacter gnavus]